MARRLDRDGTRLAQYTKTQKTIPVGDTVAVQNQTGRFTKKWDKTGTVVENQDFDKVLVKLDGSGRLTTRNRQFVKRIVSPPDLRDVPLQHQSRGEVDHEEEVPEVIADIEQMVSETSREGIDSADRSDNVLDSLDNRSEQRVAVGDHSTVEIAENDDVPEQGEGPTRPKREKRQNVRYSPEVYDLSTVTQRKWIRRS